MSVHDGHRKRKKEQFLKAGNLDACSPHEKLEHLLFYARPRGDVNPLAHALIDHFGSLSAVLDANYEELLKVNGVGDSAASLIMLVKVMFREYLLSKNDEVVFLSESQQAAKYCNRFLFGKQYEEVLMICLDGKCKIVDSRIVFSGSVNRTEINSRLIVENALRKRASAVVLAHNHPNGIALPSQEDIRSTKILSGALSTIDVRLLDHIIIADNESVSMRLTETLRHLFYNGEKQNGYT